MQENPSLPHTIEATTMNLATESLTKTEDLEEQDIMTSGPARHVTAPNTETYTNAPNWQKF